MQIGSKFSLVVVISCVFGGSNGIASAQDAIAQAKFLSEYQPGEKKLRAFYGNVTMRANYFVQDPKTGKVTLDTAFLFKANLPNLQLEATNRLATKFIPDGRVGVKVVAPSYSFRVEKMPGKDQFVLLRLVSDAKEATEHIRLTGQVFFASFSFLGDDISELFLGDDFYVKEVAEQIQNGKRQVKLIWGRKLEGFSAWTGWFVFSPEDSWAMQEYYFRSLKTNYSNRAVMEYDGKKGSTPLIKSVRYQRIQDNGTVLKSETYEVTDIVPGAVAESEFRLTAFGLPDPKPAPTRHSRWYLWLIALGIACLVLGGYFRRRYQRRELAIASPKPF